MDREGRRYTVEPDSRLRVIALPGRDGTSDESWWMRFQTEMMWTGAALMRDTWGYTNGIERDPPDTESAEWLEEGRGLPFVCLWQGWEWSAGSPELRGGIDLPPHRSVPLGAPGLAPRGLPYRPVWLGLASNTVLYAVAIWVACWTVRSIRALRHFKQGLCPRCSVDLELDYSHGCPGCGWAPKGGAA